MNEILPKKLRNGSVYMRFRQNYPHPLFPPQKRILLLLDETLHTFDKWKRGKLRSASDFEKLSVKPGKHRGLRLVIIIDYLNDLAMELVFISTGLTVNC